MIRLMLCLGVARHYLWPHFPIPLQGMASKGIGALVILCLLFIVWRQSARSKLMLAVLLWWAWEEAQTALCAGVYMLGPWTVQPGQGICTAVVGLDLGAAGLLCVAVLAYLSTLTVTNSKPNVQNERNGI